MSTIGYQLNILRDTQMVQRRLLEKQFPYIDWARMPFSSYGDFFRLRGIIDDCGAVWTNAYGRSNSEAEDTRKYLRDCSGHGRDIELFNFGYSKQSGFNGYVQDFRKWAITDESATIVKTEENLKISGNTGGWVLALWNASTANNYGKKEWAVNLHIEKSSSETVQLLFYSQSENQIYKTVGLYEGKNIIPALTEEEYSDTSYIRINVNSDSIVTLTQIAPYQGAIVGDGVDDYGQCVKDFTLPDDYTVVAMREGMMASGSPALISKTRIAGQGAFVFEQLLGTGINKVFSFGHENIISHSQLFSYQTKTSYNGAAITSGSGTDTEEDKLIIFKVRPESSEYIHVALYSFGIFTRTLTAEELRIVENCMYAEWIAMTGKLDDIEYYDILDARFRSNEEDADKRNKWVGRLGKLHMTLNNYGYSQMSGWNGWPLPRDKEFSISRTGSNYWLGYMGAPEAVKTKSWGIKIISNPTGNTISLIYISSSNTPVKTIRLQENVVNIIPPMTDDFANLAFSLQSHPVGSVVTFEQLPVYGGALVSDGVDDYAVSDEVIDEEIGGFVFHADYTGEIANKSSAGYYFATGGSAFTNNTDINSYTFRDSGNVYRGNPETSGMKTTDSIYPFSRTPAVPGKVLKIGGFSTEYLDMALYQLRLIKSQPTDVQLEAIKWQCRKEHDDYLIHMGWKEVE